MSNPRIRELAYGIELVGRHRGTIFSNVFLSISLNKDINDEVIQLDKLGELCLISADKIKESISKGEIGSNLYYAIEMNDLFYIIRIVNNYRSSIINNIHNLMLYKKDTKNEIIQLDKFSELCLILADKINKKLSECEINKYLYYNLNVFNDCRLSIYSNISSLESYLFVDFEQIIKNEKNILGKINSIYFDLADKIKNLLLEFPSPAMKTVTINATATSDAV